MAINNDETSCTCVNVHDGNCAFALTREECISVLGKAGLTPAMWALESFDHVELNLLREYTEYADEASRAGNI